LVYKINTIGLQNILQISHKISDKYPTKYLIKYLKYVLLGSERFQVQKLYKRGRKGNVQDDGWKEEEKAEKLEKRLEREVSHVLGQMPLLYL
jgi:hypothetical protein